MKDAGDVVTSERGSAGDRHAGDGARPRNDQPLKEGRSRN